MKTAVQPPECHVATSGIIRKVRMPVFTGFRGLGGILGIRETYTKRCIYAGFVAVGAERGA